MRTAVRIFVGAGCLFGLLVACTGGPGPAGSLTNGSGQNGVVERDPSGNGAGIGNRGNDDGNDIGIGNDDDDDDRGSSGASGTTSGAPPPNNEQIRAASYDRSCNVDEDCVAVYQGAACNPCRCPSEPIAKKDEGTYNSDLATKRTGCPADSPACQPCETVQVGCDPNTKQCGVGVTSADAGG